MKRCLFFLLILSCSLAAVDTVWPENLKVRSSRAVEWKEAGLATPDGGLIFVWTDNLADDRDLYAQKVDPQGNQVWNVPLTIDAKAGAQSNPALIETSDGNCVVAWRDTHASLTGEVYLQKLDFSGTLYWPAGGIRVTNNEDSEEQLMLVADELGGVILTWYQRTAVTEKLYAQSYSGSGTQRWQDGGVDPTGLDYYSAMSLLPDGANGFYLCYNTSYEVNSKVYLNRFGPDGITLWTAPACIGSGVDYDMNREAQAVAGGGAIYLLWNWHGGGDPICKLQKYSPGGTPLWAEPLQLSTSSQPMHSPLGIVYSAADDAVIISLKVWSQPATLILRKVNSSGQIGWLDSIWVDNTLPDNSYTFGSTLQADGQGGCYIAWMDNRPTGYYNKIRAKHYNSGGANSWAAEGVDLSGGSDDQSAPTLRVTADRIWLAWADRRGTETGISYQSLSLGGNPQLEEGGRVLIKGLDSMWTEGRIALARGDDLIVLWDDDRNPGKRSQIYFQVIDTFGSFTFTPDGVPATQLTAGDQYITAAKVLPNGQTVVVWHDRRESYYDLYAQLLSPGGERLWGETGLRLSNTDEGWESDVAIDYLDGSVFIGWNQMSETYPEYIGSVRMQKISGGQTQWGEGGLSLLTDPEPNTTELLALQDGYLAFSKRNLSVTRPNDIHLIRLDPADGSPLPGWGPYGVMVTPVSGTEIYAHSFAGFRATDAGAAILYSQNSVQFGYQMMYQFVTNGGQLLFGPQGEFIVDTGYFWNSVRASLGPTDFALLCNGPDSNAETFVRRYSYTLAPLWETLNLGVRIAPELIRYANNGLGLVWSENQDNSDPNHESQIKYMFVNPGGTINAVGIDSLATGRTPIYNLKSAVLGNNALLTWSDGSTFTGYRDEPIEHGNLWAQMLSNETTASGDPQLVPGLSPRLGQNWPNPFNPYTSIGYVLPQAAKVELGIYNLKGQLVKKLVNASQASGSYSVNWDGTGAGGNPLASGVYLYRLSAGGHTQSRKMVLVK